MSKTGASNDSSFGSYREVLRQVAKKQSERPVEGDEGLKLAQVLYVFGEDEAVNQLQDYSVRTPDDGTSKLTKIIARVPVLHSTLGEPTTKDITASKEKADGFDYTATAIANFPVFVAMSEDIGIPTVGDYVWVQFNKSSMSRFGVYVSKAEGKYIGQETKDSGGGGNGPDYKTLKIVPGKRVYLSKEMVKDGLKIDKKNNKPYIHSVIDGVNVYDCRGFFNPPKNGLFVRAYSSISGITMHRTGCVIGNRYEQHAKTNAHVAVSMDGNIYLMHPFTLGIFACHDGNAGEPSSFTISVEFDGNPEGYPNQKMIVQKKQMKDGKILPKYKEQIGPHPITPEQVKASKVLLKIMVDEVSKGGGTINKILAHRQTTSERDSDPGWEAWKKIAIPWQKTIGAIDTKYYRIRTGSTIPKVWDLESTDRWIEKKE